MWVVPLVSGASRRVARCWTSFQSYNRREGERTCWKSHFFATPESPHLLLHHCELAVVSVNSNGDQFQLVVMDAAFMTFVMKVEDFLMLLWHCWRWWTTGGGIDSVSGVDCVDGDWCLSLDRRPQLLHRALQILHLKLHCEILDVRAWCWFSKQCFNLLRYNWTYGIFINLLSWSNRISILNKIQTYFQ